MNPTASPADVTAAGEIILPLSDITHLFNAPSVDPLSDSPAEILGVSGVEYLFNFLHLNKKRRQARTLVLILPAGKISPDLAEQTTRALHRQADLRIAQERQELRNTYRYGWRVAAIAVFLLAVSLAISSLFTNEITDWMRPLWRTTFEYGFEIIGWVILWNPVDLLGFVPLAIRTRITTLRAIASMNVVVRAS